MTVPDLLALFHHIQHTRPHGPWLLEPREDGTYTISAGDPHDTEEQTLLGDRLHPALATATFELLTLAPMLATTLERTNRQLELALNHLNAEQLAQLAEETMPPPPSPQERHALEQLHDSLAPWRDEQDT